MLTNEEGVLTAMQEVIPTLVSKISKILICRDKLTSTSRGICYLSFENLVDSMNTHNALKSLEPPLKIDNREVIITYCVDAENRQINSRQNNGNRNHHDGNTSNAQNQYTLSDVPRLAEYSASVYAQTTAEYEHYYKYYTDYYTEQINSGQVSNMPSIQIGETANSGAAVALSAIQRKQQKQVKNVLGQPLVATVVQIPNGKDNRKYRKFINSNLFCLHNDTFLVFFFYSATPDVSQYQYDETSGYYYDPSTGLYYDPNSQYYYNSETASYLYWDGDKSTYVQAPQTESNTTSNADAQSKTHGDKATANNSSAQNSETNSENGKDGDGRKSEQKHDKVKVAKKIVKDMEKWAKQLNQKKENAFQAVQNHSSGDETTPTPTTTITQIPIRPSQSLQRMTPNGCADVGFTIMENRETPRQTSSATRLKSSEIDLKSTSDSDNEPFDQTASTSSGIDEKNLVDYGKLTCLLCKRAFQSLDILNKHTKMSNLHKENLQKLQANSSNSSLSYRDRAKERRLKYGEVDPPPPNKSRERFEKEMRKQTAQMQKQSSSNLAATPIGESNLGNRLLQKMGWVKGSGLGKSNQGRTNIIEVN